MSVMERIGIKPADEGHYEEGADVIPRPQQVKGQGMQSRPAQVLNKAKLRLLTQ